MEQRVEAPHPFQSSLLVHRAYAVCARVRRSCRCHGDKRRAVKRGAFTSSVVGAVAADGDPVNLAVPDLMWTANPLFVYDSCVQATLKASEAATT